MTNTESDFLLPSTVADVKVERHDDSWCAYCNESYCGWERVPLTYKAARKLASVHRRIHASGLAQFGSTFRKAWEARHAG